MNNNHWNFQITIALIFSKSIIINLFAKYTKLNNWKQHVWVFILKHFQKKKNPLNTYTVEKGCCHLKNKWINLTAHYLNSTRNLKNLKIRSLKLFKNFKNQILSNFAFEKEQGKWARWKIPLYIYTHTYGRTRPSTTACGITSSPEAMSENEI